MGDRIDLDAIRERHAQWHEDSLAMDEDEWDAYAHAAIEDRDVLLAKVDRLRAENIDLASSSAGWAKQVPKLLAEVDRLAEALRSIAYEGGHCLAVEAVAVSLPTPSLEDDDEDQACGVCAVCWARHALEAQQ